MNLLVPHSMTIDEFLRWAERQEGGRFELEEGRIVEMPSQSVAHLRTKARLFAALETAIRNAGLDFYALPDGATIRIPGERAYEPDALIAPLPRPPDSSLEVSNPIAVFEILSPSPSSRRRDLMTKLRGYALVPSILHYVVVDPEDRIVARYGRRGDQLVLDDELAEGTLRLDPPGLALPVEDMLIPTPAT